MDDAIVGSRIERVTGRGLVVRGADVDTDQIMPARFLKWITFQGMEKHVFEDARLEAKGFGRLHAFDDPRYAGASVLLVNSNFGCGSSREHAPQGLMRAGIRAVVGESFGEIFAGNCVSIGMPCVQVSAADAVELQDICEGRPDADFALDLAAGTISVGNVVVPTRLSEGRRRQFLEGSWDPTAVLLSAGPAIDARMRALPALVR